MSSRRPSPALRKKVFARARGYCEYCYSPHRYAASPFTAEHIIPFARGGKTVFANLAVACEGCNFAKHAHISLFDPPTGQYAPLYHPRRDRWEIHFQWDAEFLRIVPLTAIGRVTLTLLKLNRAQVVNLRRLLLGANDHPPQPIND